MHKQGWVKVEFRLFEEKNLRYRSILKSEQKHGALWALHFSYDNWYIIARRQQMKPTLNIITILILIKWSPNQTLNMSDADIQNIKIDITENENAVNDKEIKQIDKSDDNDELSAQISVRIRKMLPWEDPINCLEIDDNAVCFIC